uniref:RanBP2-type domain-containing protein n=1 Tax=Alexandrium catenella TaxID=2925 RepID=A0A7S1RI67_ALECA
MGKKPKAKAAKDEDAPEVTPADCEAAGWTCPDCEQENGPTDAVCIACEAPRPTLADPRFDGFVVGLVQTCEKVPNKDKLKQVSVDVGESEPLKIVTNAPNIKEGSRVVVAKVGAILDGEPLKKASVGGCPSEGMICDGPMLGWTGGGAGAAVLLPESFALGGPPPDSRPRGDGH